MRDKLIKLYEEAECHSIDVCISNRNCSSCQGYKYGNECRDYLKANYCIEHGVTVQEWISVNNMMPDEMEWVLCYTTYNTICILRYDYVNNVWDTNNAFRWYVLAYVTHWMPLPQPPKGE